MGQRVSLQEELINMKITSKQMVSASKKCEKNEKKYRKDVKKAGSRRPTSVPSLQYESSPGTMEVGGLFFEFAAVRTDSTEMLRAGHREGQRRGRSDLCAERHPGEEFGVELPPDVGSHRCGSTAPRHRREEPGHAEVHRQGQQGVVLSFKIDERREDQQGDGRVREAVRRY